MTYYYRKSNKDNFEDDIKDLNNKIDTIYTSLSNIIEERNNLLQIFNSRIPNENIFDKDIKVDSDGKFKLIYTCKSKPSDIHKYIFHMFIKSNFNNINLKFLINNKDFIYDIVVNNFKYLKIEENFVFDKVETFKIYLKADKPITIMKYSSYETLINHIEDAILNNQDHIKKLLNKSNKINTLNTLSLSLYDYLSAHALSLYNSISISLTTLSLSLYTHTLFLSVYTYTLSLSLFVSTHILSICLHSLSVSQHTYSPSLSLCADKIYEKK